MLPEMLLCPQIENVEIVHYTNLLWNSTRQHIRGNVQEDHGTIMVKRWLKLTLSHFFSFSLHDLIDLLL
ncbi:uncharacterized protein DS421_11g321820 [Arachis hypogaea]|nr:uncharacterized protein DS421_11g321820 [Arachis hypogaea]